MISDKRNILLFREKNSCFLYYTWHPLSVTQGSSANWLKYFCSQQTSLQQPLPGPHSERSPSTQCFTYCRGENKIQMLICHALSHLWEARHLLLLFF